ncbi:phytanoyl-CoA dioxygenase family protein [Streptomyces griseus]|uniref:phytanoyl-CoA dioxygenase family protein n=1 Tax=Streptomyces griseus TaxID=1911 RepID=UPI0036536DB0
MTLTPSRTAPARSPLGVRGLRAAVTWTHRATAQARATALNVEHREAQTEIVPNPHLTHDWANAIVRSPLLLDSVRAAIGQSVAVENTFLVMKWPGRDFVVPWHQDGIGNRIELDPTRSVAAWVAISDATTGAGCLDVITGSHLRGYLPYDLEEDTGQERGRADTVGAEPEGRPISVPVKAGKALLMDTRLLHRSGPNTTDRVRIGLNIRYVAPNGIIRRDPTCPSLLPVSGSGWSSTPTDRRDRP